MPRAEERRSMSCFFRCFGLVCGHHASSRRRASSVVGCDYDYGSDYHWGYVSAA